MSEATRYVSAVAGSPLLDSAGERLGRVEDVIARLDLGEGLPPVIGLKARIGGREMFLPIGRVERLEPAAARTLTTKLNLAQFERRPGEVLLRCDVLDRSLINVQSARLVTAREVELVCDDGTWRVAGIDTGWRARLRRLLPRPRQRRMKGLLGNNPSTAGGLMNPDFVSTGQQATVRDALGAFRAVELREQHASIVCVVDESGSLLGAVSLAGLVRAPEDEPVANLIEAPTPSVRTEEALPEVARLMTDYNLSAMPVLDADDKPVGIIAVDDVLELLLPEEWRRRAGVARD